MFENAKKDLVFTHEVMVSCWLSPLSTERKAVARKILSKKMYSEHALLMRLLSQVGLALSDIKLFLSWGSDG